MKIQPERRQGQRMQNISLNINNILSVGLLSVLTWIAVTINEIKTDNKLLNQSIGYLEIQFKEHRESDVAMFKSIQKRQYKVNME